MAKATTTLVRKTHTPAELEAQKLQQLQSELATSGDSVAAFLKLVDALHESNLLEMATALLRRGDNILEIVVEQADKPEGVRTVKNLFALINVFSTLDLSQIAGMAGSLNQAMQPGHAPQVHGVWGLLRAMRDPDIQAGLGTGLALLKALGQAQRSVGNNVDPDGELER